MNLAEQNGFELGSDGVFRKGKGKREFNYSDGEGVEQYLYQVLSESEDLSSNSAQLNAAVKDWPSEYHLSSVRANLLRALNLNGITRVLELGCGCGAITRYLGEQDGVQVDAVEGSEVRAVLAALRCKGMSNVSITTANFNELIFPENHYDLVLYVGVTEYAGRFSDRLTDQEALQDLLALAHKASTEQGITLVAIENRIGLKYLQGACEDHYGVPFVGVNNYPDSDGIRTYTDVEWRDEIAESSFVAHRFLFPFPDYKLPTLMLAESEDGDAQWLERARNALKKVNSRDYLRPFDISDVESNLWTAFAERGVLASFANSFLLVLAKRQASVDQVAKDGLVKLFSDPGLVAQYDSVQEAPAHQNLSDSSRLQLLLDERDELGRQIHLMKNSFTWRLRNQVRRVLTKLTSGNNESA